MNAIFKIILLSYVLILLIAGKQAVPQIIAGLLPLIACWIYREKYRDYGGLLAGEAAILLYLSWQFAAMLPFWGVYAFEFTRRELYLPALLAVLPGLILLTGFYPWEAGDATATFAGFADLTT